MTDPIPEYGYQSSEAACSTAYLLGPLLGLAKPTEGLRVLDVGCGNGHISAQFLARGCNVVGIDASVSGIEFARRSHSAGRFEVALADDDLLLNLQEQPFDLVISTEVVEHIYAPRPYVNGCFKALKPGGRMICSTPYNGYLKNLAIAATGKFDKHLNPLWDGGHIKMWSRKTLSALMSEAGFVELQFRGAGRFPLLWKSMLIAASRPSSSVSVAS